MFLIFTTQLYLWLCNYHAIVSYIDKREELQQEYSLPQILPPRRTLVIYSSPILFLRINHWYGQLERTYLIRISTRIGISITCHYLGGARPIISPLQFCALSLFVSFNIVHKSDTLFLCVIPDCTGVVDTFYRLHNKQPMIPPSLQVAADSHVDCYDECTSYGSDFRNNCDGFMFDRATNTCTIYTSVVGTTVASIGKDLYIAKNQSFGRFYIMYIYSRYITVFTSLLQ